MSYIKTLMENKETQELLTEHQDLILEAGVETAKFGEVLKEYIVQNPDVFMGETLEETYKNMRIFSEVATAQFLTEMVGIYGSEVNQIEEAAATYDPLSDYL